MQTTTTPPRREAAPWRRLPPGPRLPAVVQTAMMVRDPVGFLRRTHRKYGDVVRTGFAGTPGVVYVARPDLARQVFATDRDIGRAGAARQDFLESVVGPNSLLCLDGEDWVRQRRFLGSAFHGRRIEGYRDEIAAIAAEHVCRWPVGQPFGLRPQMQTIALDVILRVVFGVRDTERMESLREALPRLTGAAESVEALVFLFSTPAGRRLEWLVGRIRRNPVAQFLAAQTHADELLYDEIARRRTAHDADNRTDILSILLRARDADGVALTDAELRDGLMTLLLAGHETTATALSWTFERLVRHPAVLDRLTDSLAARDEAYLDAVIKEALRSRPIITDMPRVLTEPLDLDGYHVPAGWWVSPAAPLLHGSPDDFPEPDDFRPERFLTDDSPLQAWIPFGGGRRQCLGSQFALLEMRAIIPQVLGRLRLRPADDRGPEAARMRNVTLAPAADARVIADAR